jgi:hypothetical protein
MAVGTIHVELRGQWEADVVLPGAERRNLLRTARLLLAELITRDTDHTEASWLESFVQPLQGLVLWSQSATGSDVDHERYPPRELRKVEHASVQRLHL